MISFSEAQLMAWISPVLWPFVRVLALFTTAPVFSQKAIPVRAKVGLAFLVAVCAQATLVGQPVVSINSPQALGTLVQQIVVGLSIGFAVRLVFAALEIAGELIGLQMGLNFASFFDPASNAQISAISRFFMQIGTLIFVVINGHLLLLMAVIKSFESFPVDGHFMDSLAQMRIHEMGSAVFASAFWIALPMIAMLLFVNLALGIISRVAPQMNIYAVGFPVTLTVGLIGIVATLPMLEQPLMALLQRAMDIFGVQI
ncbi:flagellar biosynthetic protein FliR [Acidovorax sp. Be4]|uniref:Flagellar biosynthetic protein FliR n=1 Tax=Acidovorax bellezanensis TaxID=2976702 RepID=A0ABT2PQ93_9BURK|nr:flagellar biosynthetic protein FliR [Acidovorax sp. Be4]MCT9812636.1 flagellar biosynthetic protein FliR [Acidovorax sp. Be4]